MLLIFWRSGPAAAAPSIRLSLLPAVYPLAQAQPTIQLGLAPAASASLGVTTTPSIQLALGPSGLWVAQAQAAPAIRLQIAAVQTTFAQAAPAILLLLSADSQVLHAQITTVYTVYGTANRQGLVEDAIGYRVGQGG